MFSKTLTYSSIGLDIGEGSVKMLQLLKENGKFKVSSLASKAIEAIDLCNNEEERKEIIIRTIKEAYRKGLFKGKNVVTFLPSSEVDLRQITVQTGEQEEIIKALGFEADSYLPYKAKDAVLDYIEIEDSLISGEKKKKVIMVAAQRHKIDELLEILKRAGLRCVAVDILPMAQLRIVNQLDEMKKGIAFSVIDIGYEESTASIFYQGALLLSRSIHIGGNTLTKTIMKELGADESTAEKYKTRYGIEEGEGVGSEFEIDEKRFLKEKASSLILEILRDDLEALVFEIDKMFNFCSAELRGIKPKKIILVGGGAMMKNLSNYLNRKLEVNAELWNPSLALEEDKQEIQLGEEGLLYPMFATALGLALRG